jgi:hypothetical protein
MALDEDYQVVWDGAHKGTNADLLVTRDVPHPRVAPEPDRPVQLHRTPFARQAESECPLTPDFNARGHS